MNENIQSLSDIAVGEKARVTAINTDSSITRRLLDIGLIENTEVECIGRSPLGDPSAFLIRGAVIALRCDDSQKILVSQSGDM